MILKRIFDILSSLFVIVLTSPILIIISILVWSSSKGQVFYLQTRVGKGEKNFGLIKFRTMKEGADKKGLLTIGGKDQRITIVGRFLRKYKIDELPQLINILAGQMSVVGPRPEVRKYVAMYNDEQKKVLLVKPGLTDYASIEYINENEILAKANNPEQTYINDIMPSKIALNMKYINDMSFKTDMKIIFKTFAKILR